MATTDLQARLDKREIVVMRVCEAWMDFPEPRESQDLEDYQEGPVCPDPQARQEVDVDPQDPQDQLALVDIVVCQDLKVWMASREILDLVDPWE